MHHVGGEAKRKLTPEGREDNELGGEGGIINKDGGSGSKRGYGSHHGLNGLSDGSTIWRCSGGGGGLLCKRMLDLVPSTEEQLVHKLSNRPGTCTLKSLWGRSC